MTRDDLPAVDDLNRAYWDAAREGRLVIQRCADCARFHFPARDNCPSCLSSELVWTPVSGEGRIESHSAIHIPPNPHYSGPVPYILATIGLAEGVQMMANIVDYDPDSLRIGAPVVVTFEKRAEFAIPQFRLKPTG